MLFDVYMIILTSFAIFGLYTFIEMLSVAVSTIKMPTSITVMRYNRETAAQKKVSYLQNNVANNKIVFIDKDEKTVNVYTDTDKICPDEISQYITDVLFTKQSN